MIEELSTCTRLGLRQRAVREFQSGLCVGIAFRDGPRGACWGRGTECALPAYTPGMGLARLGSVSLGSAAHFTSDGLTCVSGWSVLGGTCLIRRCDTPKSPASSCSNLLLLVRRACCTLALLEYLMIGQLRRCTKTRRAGRPTHVGYYHSWPAAIVNEAAVPHRTNMHKLICVLIGYRRRANVWPAPRVGDVWIVTRHPTETREIVSPEITRRQMKARTSDSGAPTGRGRHFHGAASPTGPVPPPILASVSGHHEVPPAPNRAPVCPGPQSGARCPMSAEPDVDCPMSAERITGVS